MQIAATTCLLLLTFVQDDRQVTTTNSVPAEVQSIEIKRGHIASWPRVFAGRITDANGQPVSAALIEWGPEYPQEAPRESTVSADDGTYRLEVQKAGGTYKLGISASGFCPTWRKQLIPGPRSAPTELSFQLLPEVIMDIAVVGESGAAIPGLSILPMTPQTGFNSSFSIVQQPASIPGHDTPVPCDERSIAQLRQLLPAPEALREKANGDTTAQAEYVERFNQEGWLSLKITAGSEWVHEHQISRKDFFESEGTVRVTVPNYRNPLFRANYNGTIYAQVVDSDGAPVTHYQLTVRHHAAPFTVSDPEGRFEWGKSRDPGYSYELRIFAKGFAPFLERIVPKETSEAHPRRIELVSNKPAEFQFLDHQTLKPIASVPVVTGVSKKSGWNYVEWHDLKNYADGHHGLETVLHVVSDSDGRITVPEGRDPSTLIILMAGYGRKVITPQQRPEPDASGLMRINLEPAATIHATRAPNSRISQQGDEMYLDSRPSEGFENMFHSLHLDEDGECFIDSLAPGKYQVGLMHSDGAASTACWLKSIDLKVGQQIELPLGEMTGTLTVSGRTTPFTDVSLRAKPSLPGIDATDTDITVVATISDIDGYFELNGLHSGIYDVEQGRLSKSRYEFRSLPGPALKGPAELFLVVDTHIDYVKGTVEPPESAVETPARGK